MILTIWIGKLLRALTRLAGGGGSALPGYWIERFSPNFLKKTLSSLPKGVIIVTGTNGKTTTTKIISDLLTAQGHRVLTNRSGDNFVRGVISTIIRQIGWTGKLNYDIAVFEQDEAYAVRFVNQYKPRGVVALNIGRDQLDRFGEIDKTAELIGDVVSAAKEFAVLNSNDPRIAKLRPKLKAKAIWFGHNETLTGHFTSDDQHHADKARFFEATKPNVRLDNIYPKKIGIDVAGEPYEFKTVLSGAQNALNVTAALAAILSVDPKTSMDIVAEALATAEPAFGRGEAINLKSGGELKLQLVKNPSSFRHNLNHLDKGYGTIGIAINDDYADGRDVSWLWDVDFKHLKGRPNIVCGGARAYDMANRLKYDEVKATGTHPSLSSFVREVCNSTGNQSAVIFCTYTAMLKIRKLLKPYARNLSGGLKA